MTPVPVSSTRPFVAAAALALAIAIAAFLPGAARAAGVNLSWDECGPAGQPNRTFACDTDTGRSVLVGSVVSPVRLERFVGADIAMDLQTGTLCCSAGPMPSWWDLSSPTGCRAGALSMSVDFSSPPSGGTACRSVFGGTGGGGIGAYNLGFGGPSRARLVAFWAQPYETVLTTVETYIFRFVIDHRRTIGADACEGCHVPVVIVLNMIRLAQPAGVGDYEITNAAHEQYVHWSGTTPVRGASWGLLKSLYR